jgi:murein L,D-transpeptidase YcbB/YkuD
MKQSMKEPMKLSRIFPAPLLLAALLCSFAQAQVALSPADQTWLRTTIPSGNLPDLRWPNFSDYSKHVQKFYDFNGDSLWWVSGMEPTPQARQLIALLLQADQKGLQVDDYDGPRWADRLAKLKPATSQPAAQDAVKFDLALTISAMRYISDLHIGKVNPKHLAFELDDESKKYDLAEFLRDHVTAASDVAGVLAQVEPPYPGYRRTLQAFRNYVELAKKDDGEQLPPPNSPKKALAPGDAWPGVPRLTRLLRLVGDLPADANVPADQTVYDGALVDAVKNFQRRLGRDADGRIGAQTLADLNVPLSRRVQQMQWTLERWRWLPEIYQKAPIVVNIPEFRLRAYDENFNIGLTMNVVVGQAYGHGTPVFSENMQYLIFRPYWDVPASITRAEIVPHLVKDPDYVAKDRLEIVDSRRNPVSTGPVSSDMIDQLRAGKLFIRQTPGPKNSLGLVVFLFPNSYAVYMHDTPAPEFFAQSRRDFSHGCIRLEKPADLAAWVLRDKTGWTPERIRAAMTTGTNAQQVNLAHPIPVLIIYATVVVLEDGLVHFYDDIYHHDAALEKVLAKGYPYPW